MEAEARTFAQLRAACEPFAALQLEALKPESERSGSKLEEHADAARVALGSPSEAVLGSVEGFLAQVARWPVSEHPKRAQHPQEPEHALEDARAELERLRSHVGAVVRAAREELERLRPARFARELERRPFDPLPTETPKRD